MYFGNRVGNILRLMRLILFIKYFFERGNVEGNIMNLESY